MTDIRIATRQSPLALAQANIVAGQLTLAHPGLRVEFVPITTSGDRDQRSPVSTLTETGAFVRSIQYAVLDGRADLAVHSGKDLPVIAPDGLVSIYPPRISPWDALCGSTLDDLPHGAIVGTGSPRRAAQLRLLRPDLDLREIRGNVETRLAKVDAGEYGATVLAEAGLTRAGLAERIDQRFDLASMVPAAAQGALTIEALDGSETLSLANAIDDASTRRTVLAERAVLAISQAGCRTSLGVLAVESANGLTLTGFVDDEHGPRRAHVVDSDPQTAARMLCDALRLTP